MPKTQIAHNRPFLDHLDWKALRRPLDSGWIARGLLTEKFERTLAKYIGQRFSTAVSSGTAAIHLALLALGVKQGDEVILPAYVCSALLHAVQYVRARPVLVDMDPVGLGPSSDAIRKKISRRTKAIIVNHTFGFPADIQKIKSFGKPVIEDCSQALGSETGGKKLGSFGDFSVLSFYATKIITTGYGGMLLTQNAKLHKRVRELTHCDQHKTAELRYHYSFSDLQAALGLSQLAKLPDILRRRRSIAHQYQKALTSTSFYFWNEKKGDKVNFYRFPLGGTLSASVLQQKFSAAGIETISPWASYQMLYRYTNGHPRHYPVAETLCKHLVSVPIYPSLSSAQASLICTSLRKIAQ